MAPQKQKYPHPDPVLFDLVASALGELTEATVKRGAKVLEFIYQMFETNDHEHRENPEVICSRIVLATWVVGTLERRETDRCIENNPRVASQALNVIGHLQRVIDTLKRKCTASLEKAKTKAPELAGAGALN
ncbi:MAG: hypothetical protein WC091_07355 [Sulfuricellaceae bacterium]